ncbi:MAG: hypothetical protein LUD84_06230 [Clostridiales bacterium]|nr:hypothetical protein [Clostridiales bacterium]
MKRFLSLCLAAALFLALAGCASSEKQELKAALDEANGYTTVDYTMSDGTTLEQTVLYDKNGIVVTALGVEGATDDCYLTIRLENNTGSAVHLYSSSVQVNGWEASSSLWMDVSRNSMGRKRLNLYNYGEPDSIQLIRLDCELMDGDYNTIDTISAALETSAYTGALPDEELPGDVLYEGSGVTLTFGGIQQERYSSYAKLQFYVENTGKKSVTLESEAFRLCDDYEMDAFLYETVSAGAKKAFYIYIDQDDIYDLETDAYEYYDEDYEDTFDWTAFMPIDIDLTCYQGYSTLLFSTTVTIGTSDVELVDEDEAADWVDESNIDGDTDEADIAIAEEEPVEEDAANVMDDTDTAAAEEETDAAAAEEETAITGTEDVRTA